MSSRAVGDFQNQSQDAVTRGCLDKALISFTILAETLTARKLNVSHQTYRICVIKLLYLQSNIDALLPRGFQDNLNYWPNFEDVFLRLKP